MLHGQTAKAAPKLSEFAKENSGRIHLRKAGGKKGLGREKGGGWGGGKNMGKWGMVGAWWGGLVVVCVGGGGVGGWGGCGGK